MCANGVANGGKSFLGHVFPRHRQGSWASGSFARRPMPYKGPKGLASAQCLVSVHGRVQRKLGENASKGGVFPNAVPESAVQGMHASNDEFVLA